jgi:hypothetical protein
MVAATRTRWPAIEQIVGTFKGVTKGRSAGDGQPVGEGEAPGGADGYVLALRAEPHAEMARLSRAKGYDGRDAGAHPIGTSFGHHRHAVLEAGEDAHLPETAARRDLDPDRSRDEVTGEPKQYQPLGGDADPQPDGARKAGLEISDNCACATADPESKRITMPPIRRQWRMAQDSVRRRAARERREGGRSGAIGEGCELTEAVLPFFQVQAISNGGSAADSYNPV